MNIQEFSVLGYYEPGFLHMRVNTEDEMKDLNELAADESKMQYFSTFLHEYIHFLQELTTTSGIYKCGSFINLIRDINLQIKADSNAEFKVPVEVDNHYNSTANEQLERIYRGQHKVENYAKYSHYSFVFTDVLDKDGIVRSPRKYTVFYYDQSGRQQEFHFGYSCLKEYVAHTQNLYRPIEHPDIPYLIAELIVATEYGILNSNQLFIVALCDACLMSFHRADTFFNMLELMKKESFVPTAPKDIYTYVFNTVKFSDDGKVTTIWDLHAKTTEFTLEGIDDALKSDVFTLNKQWLKHIILEAVVLRISYPHFMTEIVQGPGRLSNLFYLIFQKIGTPFFTNNKSIGGFIPPVDLKDFPDQPYQLLVFKEILRIYFGHKNCSLYEFCKGRPDNDITNSHCLTSPWLRATENDLCPFGQFWKTWGLIGKIPVQV